MNIYISDKIYDKFKSETDKEKIRAKIYKFAEELFKERSNITSLSKGSWARRIISFPNRYKFRVNNKDRIIFEYGKDKNEIYFLDYCNHDSQIRTVKSIKSPLLYNSDIAIDYSNYIEDDYDKVIDYEQRNTAFTFLYDDNYKKALEFFSKSGDIKNKKLVSFIINTGYDDFKNDFSNSKYRSYIRVIPKIKLKSNEILYILNKFYSDFKLIFGPYCCVKFQSVVQYIFVDGKYKKISDYNKVLSDKLLKYIDNISGEFEIVVCLYDDKNFIKKVEASSYTVDLNTRLITKNNYKNYLNAWNLAITSKCFDDAKNIKFKDSKLSKRNLDFIFKK